MTDSTDIRVENVQAVLDEMNNLIAFPKDLHDTMDKMAAAAQKEWSDFIKKYPTLIPFLNVEIIAKDKAGITIIGMRSF